MSQALKIGIIMDPIADISFKKDSSLALLLAAAERGHSLFYMEMQDIYLSQGRAQAKLRPLKVWNDAERWYELGESENQAMAELDVILMRKDPPFDSEYIYATYVLERAEQEGCLVVNKAQSLRDCNEKIFATQFPQCCPPVLVAREAGMLRDFHREHGDVIFKPLDGMGGAGIFRCKSDDSNVSVILETLTNHGSSFIMAQKYLPEIKHGDKRVLVVDGEAVPYALARIPASGESRGNLAAGGSGRPQALSERDQWIVEQVAPTLKAKGLLFVGLDIIGDYLTEINVTSPTCVREIDAAYDTRIGERLMLAIEALRN
ncbi:glutathione synthase [Agaribacterium haliotis]|uniref:glutathione synthase n=1 Tax=Agaribacterium haliotis TaxID=2013869 RepID=UPI000BB561BB|nr:glutathione synthase [Agaribacterium haliotis]